jgi:hypothetical protein
MTDRGPTDRAAWRVFRQMQTSVLAAGLLLYAIATLDAWQVLDLTAPLKLRLTLLLPGALMVLSLAATLAIPALRRAIRRHLWLSFNTGFGQTVISVVVGLGVLIAVAGLIVWQTHHLATGGTYHGGAFSGFGAGLGVLIAQAILVRGLENGPKP